MLDVHAPHETVHTWRDFFIHIATIAVGLLLAIGLEQTVEFFHHRHQRHLSEERILAQAERNRALTDSVEQADYYLERSALGALRALQAAPVKGGRVTFTAPAYHKVTATPVTPSMEAWETAKADGTVSLFPPGESEACGRVYFELQRESTERAVIDATLNAIASFRDQTPVSLEPGKTTMLSIAERAHKLASLMATFAGLFLRDLVRWEEFAAVNQSLLDGATDLQQLLRRGGVLEQRPYQPTN